MLNMRQFLGKINKIRSSLYVTYFSEPLCDTGMEEGCFGKCHKKLAQPKSVMCDFEPIFK